MNSGRYLGTITANQHGKSVIDQLGWSNAETFGHWYHGLFLNLQRFWPTAFVINQINSGRRKQFIRERDAAEAAKKAEQLEKTSKVPDQTSEGPKQDLNDVVQASLYERLGGEAAIDLVVEGMYVKIFNDPDLSDFFKKTDKERQKAMQKAFLTFATGGPSEYHGKSMADAHKGRGIQDKEFNLVAGHVVSTMTELQIPEALINETANLLLSLRGDCTNDSN